MYAETNNLKRAQNARGAVRVEDDPRGRSER